MLFIHLDCFGELLSFKDFGHGDICLLSNIMELGGTQAVMLKAPTNTFQLLSEVPSSFFLINVIRFPITK